MGFASFASHLPTGYLDNWHGVGTLLLTPVFVFGIIHSRQLVRPGQGNITGRLMNLNWGRRLAVATGAGLVVSAAVIMTIGTTVSFMASDLEFIGLEAGLLTAINNEADPPSLPMIGSDSPAQSWSADSFSQPSHTLVKDAPPVRPSYWRD